MYKLEYVKRNNTNSIKWDVDKAKGVLPMWIADMDFKTDERLIKELNKHINHGAYGYSMIPNDYYDVYISWYKRRNNVSYKKDWIRFSPGAVNGLKQCIKSFTKENDAILITTPVYPPFFYSIKETKRKLVTSKLLLKDNYFSFDYQDIEKKFKNQKVKMMILCNPHNPGGRVWKKGEIEELLELCKKYKVLMISDEVHSDIIMPDQIFTPALSFKKYQDNIITLNSLSKTLNLAMFHHSHVLIPNEKLRNKFDKFQEEIFANSPNNFNLLPTYYGYKYADKYVDELCETIYENYNYLKKRLGKYIDILSLEGTYLIFINLDKYCKNAAEFLYQKAKIYANPGESFGKGYDTWARLNLATSKANIKKACDQILKAISK